MLRPENLPEITVADSKPPSKKRLNVLLSQVVFSAENSEFNHSTTWEINKLRTNMKYFVEHDMLDEKTTGLLYHKLWLREAVLQLRSMTGDITFPGPNDSWPSVVTTLDSVQAYGHFLHDVIQVSGLGKQNVVNKMRRLAHVHSIDPDKRPLGHLETKFLALITTLE